MGFFSNVGETLFGTKTRKKANAATKRSEKKLDKVGSQADTLGADYMSKANRYGAVAEDYGKTIQENKNTAKQLGEVAKGYSGAIDRSQASAEKYGKQSDKYGSQADVYDEQTKQNLGTSAADYMSKQQSAAEAGAERQGQQAATSGTQAALRSARSSGLSKGQSALASAQQAGDIYSGAYNTGLESGKQNYTQGTQLQQSQGQAMSNRQQNAASNQAQAASNEVSAQNAQTSAYGNQLSAQSNVLGAQNSQQGAYGTQLAAMGGQNSALNTKLGAATGQANVAQNQYQNAANKSAQTWGTIGTLASSTAMMLSDENAKTNITDISKDKDKTKETLSVTLPAAVKASEVSTPATAAAPGVANNNSSGSFDKERLAKMLSSIGNAGSGINSSSPVTTSGINAAQDTTAASRKQLNDSIMTISTYMKDGPMKKINSILGQGTDMKAVQTATNSAKTAAASDAASAAASGAAAGSGAGAAGSGAAATGATTGGAGAAGAAGGGSAAAAGGAAKGAGILAKLGPLAALSDENAKTDIKGIRDRLDKIDVKEIAKKIRPVTFEYKAEAEAIDPKAKPGVEHVGVIAQDLEKTALAPAVKMGDDGFKRIDIAELTPALLNMILQMQNEINELKRGTK